MIKGIHNFSEIGKLQRVLLHRPGREIEALTPSTMERLLFDDVPFLKAAQEEHDAFADLLRKNGVEVIICAAGKAAHLGGVIAAYTTLPVIGLPVKTDMMGGLDSLLSIVQMPSGIPVATVGVNGGENAGLLALQILGIRYPEIAHKLKEFKKQMAQKINADDAALQEELKNM